MRLNEKKLSQAGLTKRQIEFAQVIFLALSERQSAELLGIKLKSFKLTKTRIVQSLGLESWPTNKIGPQLLRKLAEIGLERE